MGSPLADLPPPQVDPEQVRRVVQEVLARPEYREAVPTVRERILAFLGDQLGRLLDLLAGSRQGSLIASLLILAAVGFVAFLGVRFGRGLRRDPGVAAAASGPVGRRADEWRADAQEHE
ncbi:MAG: hypothetical protein M3N52_04895, partial [Actinomycetota bacterium]|nr:hypothetical protein [Actinomycetota bacterium]